MTHTRPDYVMEILRLRNDLGPKDETMDVSFDNLSPIQALREICAWKLGYPDWADEMIRWAKDCGFEVIR